MRNVLPQLVSAAGLLAIAGAAIAGDFQPVPEPGVLELAVIGGIAAVVAGFARRRK
jgi:hypothetical protein